MSNSLIIFLDDVRDVPKHLQNVPGVTTIVCRSSSEFRSVVLACYKLGDHLELHLDHDLGEISIPTGEEITGLSCLQWFDREVIRQRLYFQGDTAWLLKVLDDIQKITVHSHSSNPVGRENILKYWEWLLARVYEDIQCTILS